MTPKSVPVSKIINITNRLLNKLVKKRFGNHITIRVNSIHFLSNCYLDNGLFVPEINLKTSKRISLDELKNIDFFLLNQLNTILKITLTDIYVKIINIRLLVK